jgi:hypothetical protein
LDGALGRRFLEALGEGFRRRDSFIGPLPLGRVQGFELLNIGLQRRVVCLGCDRLPSVGGLVGEQCLEGVDLGGAAFKFGLGVTSASSAATSARRVLTFLPLSGRTSSARWGAGQI